MSACCNDLHNESPLSIARSCASMMMSDCHYTCQRTFKQPCMKCREPPTLALLLHYVTAITVESYDLFLTGTMACTCCCSQNSTPEQHQPITTSPNIPKQAAGPPAATAMAFLRHQTLLLLAAAALTLSTTAQAARVLQGFITVPATNPVSDASSCRWNNQAYSTGTWAYCPKCQDYSYCYW